MLSQVSYCHSLGWHHMAWAVTLLLSGVVLSFQMSHCHCCFSVWSQVSQYHSLGWLHIVLCAPQFLTEFALHCLGCPIAAHKSAFMSLQVFHCHLLEWLCVIPALSLPLMYVVLHLSKWHTVTHWGCSVLFQFFDCQSLGLLCVASSFHLPLTKVIWCCLKFFNDINMALCHPTCPTASYEGVSESFQLFHFHLLKWLCVISCVSLSLTGITLCCFRCFMPLPEVGVCHSCHTTAPPWCEFAFFLMPHCLSLR